MHLKMKYFFQIILVMREDEYEKLSTNRILVDKFRLVRMQSPSTENLQIIFEQIVLWHLHTKYSILSLFECLFRYLFA